MIRAGENGPVKIGHSVNPIERLSNLQMGHYETLRIIRLFEGGAEEEAALHVRFADLHLKGEWHSFSRVMMGDLGLIEMPIAEDDREATPLPIFEALLDEVEVFLIVHGMRTTAFGIAAVNDGKFVSRLRAGMNMTAATIAKVRSFMGHSRIAPVPLDPAEQRAIDFFAEPTSP